LSAKYNLICDQATTFNFQFQYMVFDALNGRITVTIPASVTEDIAASRYSYDLVLNSGGTITRILEGKFVVTGAVTT